jgi:hypothetical protein
MSTISAGTGTGTALVSTGDTTGNLVLQTNGTTTALTLNTAQALGVGSTPSFGSSGQVLTSGGSGAAPTWAGLPASGMNLVSTITASSSSTIDFANLTAYDTYVVVFNKAVAGGGQFQMSFSTNNGSTFLDANYRRTFVEVASSSIANGGGAGSTLLALNNSTADSTASNGGINGYVYLFRPNAASKFSISSSLSYLASGALQHCLVLAAGSNDTTTAVNAVRFLPGGGTFASGVFRLYGLANS